MHPGAPVMHGPRISRRTPVSPSRTGMSTAKIEPSRLGGDGTPRTRDFEVVQLEHGLQLLNRMLVARDHGYDLVAGSGVGWRRRIQQHERDSYQACADQQRTHRRKESPTRPRDQSLSGCTLQIAPDDEQGWHTVADEQLGNLYRLITVVIAPIFADSTGVRPQSSGCAEFRASDAPES